MDLSIGASLRAREIACGWSTSRRRASRVLWAACIRTMHALAHLAWLVIRVDCYLGARLVSARARRTRSPQVSASACPAVALRSGPHLVAIVRRGRAYYILSDAAQIYFVYSSRYMVVRFAIRWAILLRKTMYMLPLQCRCSYSVQCSVCRLFPWAWGGPGRPLSHIPQAQAYAYI